ncbi:acyl-CoA/acyl-ACP dehydrogenase [Candidatus Binatia bacterium]|nr:acyl-CoA/acyl-ACP dehydrogenase [Candidatus Binatia bacterium]
MDFALSEEQELLQQSARDFLARECAPTVVRQTMATPEGYSPALHQKMAALGWTGLVIPEKFGGLGLGLLDLAVLCEELGRAAVPGPFFATAVLGALSLVHARGATAQQKLWLPQIAAGEALATLAVSEGEPCPTPAAIRTRCTSTRSSFRLSGTKLFVPDAHVADLIVTAARTRGRDADGVCLFAVPRDTPGVTVRPLPDVDQTRRPCAVELRDVELPKSARLADEPAGWRALSRVTDAACVTIAADSLGGSQRALEMAVDYARTREQFGRPIGSFQALKHMAAEMVSEIEPARSLVWYAAYAYDHEPRRAGLAAAMAKARLTDIYSRTTNRAVQMHGGIGFTWEHDMQLWFKRALWNRTAFGDAVFHRERVATLSV